MAPEHMSCANFKTVCLNGLDTTTACDILPFVFVRHMSTSSIGNYVAMWLLNYSGCGTFRDFESDIFMNFRLWVSLLYSSYSWPHFKSFQLYKPDPLEGSLIIHEYIWLKISESTTF